MSTRARIGRPLACDARERRPARPASCPPAGRVFAAPMASLAIADRLEDRSPRLGIAALERPAPTFDRAARAASAEPASRAATRSASSLRARAASITSSATLRRARPRQRASAAAIARAERGSRLSERAARPAGVRPARVGRPSPRSRQQSRLAVDGQEQVARGVAHVGVGPAAREPSRGLAGHGPRVGTDRASLRSTASAGDADRRPLPSDSAKSRPARHPERQTRRISAAISRARAPVKIRRATRPSRLEDRVAGSADRGLERPEEAHRQVACRRLRVSCPSASRASPRRLSS